MNYFLGGKNPCQKGLKILTSIVNPLNKNENSVAFSPDFSRCDFTYEVDKIVSEVKFCQNFVF